MYSVLHREDYLLTRFAEVETIVRNCNKEEIRRRMSHGELLRDFSGEAGPAGEQMKSERRAEEEKTTFFNAQVAKLHIHTDGPIMTLSYCPGDAKVPVRFQHYLQINIQMNIQLSPPPPDKPPA